MTYSPESLNSKDSDDDYLKIAPVVGEHVLKETDSAEKAIQKIQGHQYWNALEQQFVETGILPRTGISFDSPVSNQQEVSLGLDLLASNPNKPDSNWWQQIKDSYYHNIEHPYRERIDELMGAMTKTDAQSWEHAAQVFPQFTKHPDISPILLKAYVANEMYHYDKIDLAEDIAATNGIALDDKTLGTTQLTPKAIRELETGFVNGHKVREPYTQLTQFLASKGYSGPEHEIKALLDPECAPMLAAAKAASLIEDLEKHHVAINTKTLAYAFNPDVYSYNDGNNTHYKAMYGNEVNLSKATHWDQRKEQYASSPQIIQSSRHIQNVLRELDKL